VPPPKILVIRGGAIGDFILTLPVLAALRSQFPRVELEVLGYSHIAELAVAGGLAERVRRIEARPLAGFFARHGDLDPELMDYFAGFEIIVSYLYDPDQVFQDNVARCGPAQFIAGPHRPSDQLRCHATELLLQPLERLAIFGADPIPRLALQTTPTQEAAQPSESTLAIHPGSGSERKNWPEEAWTQLLKSLISRPDRSCLIVGGEAEGARIDRMASAVPAQRCRVAKSLPLVRVAELLRHCDGFLGHDSGISHLAAALGIRGLILWGPTPIDVWRPRGDHIRILHHAAGLESLSVATVLENFQEWVEP